MSIYSWKKVALLVAATILFSTLVSPAFASTQSKKYHSKTVQRWRPTVVAAAKHYHVYSKWIVNKCLWIIAGENGGGEHSKKSKACVGLLQFNRNWVKSRYGKTFRAPILAHLISHIGLKNHPKDWRQCGTCSIYRFMKVYHDGGKRKIKSTWRATW